MEINNKSRLEIQKYVETLQTKYNMESIEIILVNDFLTIKNILDCELIKDYEKYDIEYIGAIKSIEFLEYAFELLTPEENKKSEGVVFTPEYLVDFIETKILSDDKILEKKIIDPCCGTGVFLRRILLQVKEKTGVSYKEIIERCLYGIDISEDNIRRVKIIFTLECILANEDYEYIKFNLFVHNSLEMELHHICDVEEKFDYIVGNPPYSNAHDLNKDMVKFLKKNFVTTKKGTFNIFYAFIEHSMKSLKETGELGFIIPNNFLKIEAAEPLRKYLANNKYIKEIIDFTSNKIFSPVMTYNAIIFLNKKELENEIVKYSLIERTENINESLINREILKIHLKDLDEKMWNLLDVEDLENIKKIKNAGIKIGTLIRTGIATLKDEVYILDGYDEAKEKYFKMHNGEIYFIEKTFVKSFYKISAINSDDEISKSEKFIIFPYENKNGKNEIVEEEVLAQSKGTYEYLQERKCDLLTRSSHNEGVKKKLKWYEYGRSQAIGKFGKKLIYPTFSDKPKFTLLEKVDVLFANGYAVFDDCDLKFEVLQRILNSKVLEYFVSKTSYTISGGYYCYQKKYISDFAIPDLNTEEQEFILNADKNTVDEFLIEKYELNIV